MIDKTRGLYEKFVVRRTDLSDLPGGKHDGCEYFVLDLTHDKHAEPAIRAYAESCKSEFPQLSSDLFRLVSGLGSKAPTSATCEELLATAQRLREQARRLNESAQYADSSQARTRDQDAARDCIRKAEQMEKEAQA